ncbi:glycosyltransferase family 2 protein [uncultured Prevotella sp.]|uniref:glycosyltransferase family 2 protein n=1 Tax=uncultured Prevotella sp. TaxID=159272 RepID=UPI002601D864|nr:glycosyltransferase family 2 protein [uncultured Prevotella sp.]
MKLVIVVPCYNEEEVLAETRKRLIDVLKNLVDRKKIDRGQILFVDDGSRDHTWQLIEQFAKETPMVGGLKLSCNRGHQFALWAGLRWAAENSDASVSIDADLQDDVNAIYDMVDAWLDGNDIVYGVRRERKTDTFFKRNTALAFYRLMTALGGKIIYNHADFRLMSRRAMQSLMQYPEDNLFLRGIVASIGYPSASVYYDRSERFAGESKYPLKKMLAFALEGITSFSVKPLRVITYLGLLFILVALGVIAYALYEHFAGHTIAGWTSLLVSMWFIGGSILLACGVTGEYIGKIYLEVKRRPKYFIDKKINA